MPGKNPTVKSLKIGDTIVFGAYSAQGRGENPVPILWVKASTNCDFVTEHVVDLLSFDVRGAMRYVDGTWVHDRANTVYRNSTLFQFLNSEEDGDQWFCPADGVQDTAPAYVKHAGFLHYFSAAELDALLYRRGFTGDPPNALARVHLMSEEDVFGDNKLPLFRKRRGIRAKPSQDLYWSGRCWQTPSHYIGYMTRSYDTGGIVCVGRDAALHRIAANAACGLRPLVRLNPDAKIAIGEDGMWHIVAGRRYNHAPVAKADKSNLLIPGDVLGLLGLV